MCIVSFKERVKNVAIANADLYNKNYVEYEYLVCSKAFDKGYHIIKSDPGNYLHLIGIHTLLSAQDFFDKCISRKLETDDFDFIKPGKSEKAVKGSVREKIKVLPCVLRLFEQDLVAEDNFKKNMVECAFATTNNICTLGFVASGRPKSLLKGNELDKSKSQKVDLIFRRRRSSSKLYNELIKGNEKEIVNYYEKIKNKLNKNILNEEWLTY